MDDAIASRLQFMENPRQCGDRSRLDVVQQQNASSFFLEPLHREIVDARGRNMPPVVSQKIGAQGLDALWGEIVLDAFGARKAGERKNGGSAASSPSAAFTDAIPSSISCLARSTGILFILSG